jgi:hypothetical protein
MSSPAYDLCSTLILMFFIQIEVVYPELDAIAHMKSSYSQYNCTTFVVDIGLWPPSNSAWEDPKYKGPFFLESFMQQCQQSPEIHDIYISRYYTCAPSISTHLASGKLSVEQNTGLRKFTWIEMSYIYYCLLCATLTFHYYLCQQARPQASRLSPLPWHWIYRWSSLGYITRFQSHSHESQWC